MSKSVSLICGSVGSLLACFALYQIVEGLLTGRVYENWSVVHGSYVTIARYPVWFCFGLVGYVIAFIVGCAAIVAMLIFTDEKPD